MILYVSSSSATIIYSGVKNISFTAAEPNNIYTLNIDLADDITGTWDNIKFEMFFNNHQISGTQTSFIGSPSVLAYETNFPYIEKYSLGDEMTGQFGSGSFILFNYNNEVAGGAKGFFRNTTGYAGLSLGDFGGQDYFGWMQLSVENFDPGNINLGPTITIIDWAYSTEPGLPVRVGAVPVPEPTTLTLLALGLAGIGFSRKKYTHKLI